MEKTLELVTRGVRSFRILARYHGKTHFAAFDVNNNGARTSVIAIEPAVVGGSGPNFLAPSCAHLLGRKLPNAEFFVVDGRMQYSGGECGMFSLFLVKAMFKDKGDLKLLHEDTTSARFHQSHETTSGSILPPRFMKHTQSRSRLDEYLSANKNRVDDAVNKRGEALEPRFMRHWGEWNTHMVGQKSFSRSIEFKRVREYQALLDAIDEESCGQP